MHSIEIDVNCYRTGKYTVCRHVPASFSLEILQAGAVKGLTHNECRMAAICWLSHSQKSDLQKKKKVAENSNS